MRTTLFFIPAIVLLFITSSISFSQRWEWRNPLPHGETFIDMVGRGDSIFATTSSDILQFSSDAGETWEIRFADSVKEGGKITLVGNKIYLSNMLGFVSVTSNWGESWQKKLDEHSFVKTKIIGFFTPETGFIAGDSINSFILLKTTNGGDSWTKEVYPSEYVNSGIVVNEHIAFLCGYVRVSSQNAFLPLLKVTDKYGLSWQNITTLPSSASNIYSCYFFNRQIGFIVTDDGLYKTSDGGKTWEKINTAYYNPGAVISFNRSFETAYLVHNRSDIAVSRSTDKGMTWVPVLVNVDGPTVSDIYVSGKTVTYAYGGGGLIYRTTDRGLIWEKVHGIGVHLSFFKIHFLDFQNGVALTYGNAYAVTKDGGKNWISNNLPESLSMRDVDFASPDIGYAIVKNKNNNYFLIKTNDGGFTWNSESPIPIKNYSGLGLAIPRKIQALNDEYVYISADYGGVYRTHDGGKTWKEIQLFPDYIIDNYYFSSFFAYDYNHVFMTIKHLLTLTDDGYSSYAVYDPAGINNSLPLYTDIYFTSPEKGFICGIGMEQGLSLMTTTDGGKHWDEYPGVAGIRLDFFSDKLGFLFDNTFNYEYLGKGFITTNGGTTWNSIYIPKGIQSLFFFNENKGWGVGQNGRIMEYVK